MAFDKIVGVDGTTYQFPSVVRQRIADNIELAGSVENLAVIDALAPALATKSDTTHNHTLASLSSNAIDELSDVEIGVVGSNGIALADKHTLQYESSTSKWRNKVASGGVTVSDTPPATPIPGDAWFDSNDGTLYVYYTDVNTAQWVQVQANSALEGTILSRLGALESRATALEAVADYSPNYIINGAFDIWQRGTTATIDAANKYKSADRWSAYRNGGNATESRQLAGLTGFQYCTRIQRNSGNTALDVLWINQSIETVNSIPLAGKTVTLSFYARAGANYSAASNILSVFLKTGTGTDQNVLSGFTGALTPIGASAVLTTSWQRFTFTAPLSSSLTQIGLQFAATPTGTAGAADYYEITGVQLEEGSVATPFRRNANSIQGELAACQRYYYRAVGGAAFSAMPVINTGSTNATTILGAIALPVQMRVFPHTLEAFALRAVNLKDDWTTTVTNVSLSSGWASSQSPGVTFTTGGGMTANEFFRIGADNNGGAYIGLSAEL